MNADGKLIILAAPSGAGKSTIAARLRDVGAARLSISHTTRPPRSNEHEGKQYFFVGEDEFAAMRARGEFLEWAKVHNNFYGTSEKWVREQLAQGETVLLEIDCQGAEQVRAKMAAVAVFVSPPSMAELERRLRSRGENAPDEMRQRLAAAEEEIRRKDEFDYVIINDDLDASVARVRDIISKSQPQRRTGNGTHHS